MFLIHKRSDDEIEAVYKFIYLIQSVNYTILYNKQYSQSICIIIPHLLIFVLNFEFKKLSSNDFLKGLERKKLTAAKGIKILNIKGNLLDRKKV